MPALPSSDVGSASTSAGSSFFQTLTDDPAEVLRRGLALHPDDFALREDYARHLARLDRTAEAVAACLGERDDGRGNRRDGVKEPTGGPGGPPLRAPDLLRRIVLAGDLLAAAGRGDEAKETWKRLIDVSDSPAEGQRYYRQGLAQRRMAD